jgi:ATP-dependent DNA helicase RecQ
VVGPEPDAGLLATLKGLRRELSRAEEVPAYRVFTDRALAEMAALRPTTEAALAEVHGVGPAKLARYGEAFLAAIRADAGMRGGS